MTSNVTHRAWDDGAILDAFADVFGNGIREVIGHKTTKTYCGKRVAMSKIDNTGQHTCVDCARVIAEQAAGLAKLAEIERQYGLR